MFKSKSFRINTKEQRLKNSRKYHKRKKDKRGLTFMLLNQEFIQ
jgi:hypothetical protein